LWKVAETPQQPNFLQLRLSSKWEQVNSQQNSSNVTSTFPESGQVKAHRWKYGQFL
jgi:hypothetical protein